MGVGVPPSHPREAVAQTDRRPRWHTFRHTFARLYLEDWGGDLMELASFLGHRSVETTRDYYQHFGQSAAVRMGRRKVYGEG